MKAPLSWLRDFAPFESDVSLLADTLSDLGLVVEGIDRIRDGLDGVLVARVLDISPIPGAEKVRSITVDAGRGEERIVCGAWNFSVGDHVALAPVGTVLPVGMEIAARKIRGVESRGMLCSAYELGLSEDREGLLVLGNQDTVIPGTSLSEAIGIQQDTVFDLALEGNRPDALSIFGVARDLAARMGIALYDRWLDGSGWGGWFDGEGSSAGGNGSARGADVAGHDIYAEDILPGGTPTGSSVAHVVVDSIDLCPRFTASVFSAVSVKESPAWLARRLTLAGMRPINNIVDASNYVMLELGQPTHPYDLDLLADHTIRVRASRSGEKMVTLDGVERVLGARSTGPGDDLRDCVICDGDDIPIGIAGIMGGASTEISASTRNVLLEAAYFQPMAISRTSKRLALRSEASVRFERGCDPYAIGRAVRRFYDILLKTYEDPSGDGMASSYGKGPDDEAPVGIAERPVMYLGSLDTRGDLPRTAPISVSVSRLNGLLGIDLATRAIMDRLERIGFRCTQLPAGVVLDAGSGGVAGAMVGSGEAGDSGIQDSSGDIIEVTPPSYRPDVLREADVAEEVARHIGYSSIVPRRPRSPKVGRLTGYHRRRRLLREVVAGMGAFEAWCPTIVDPESHLAIGLRGMDVTVENPLNAEESVLRRSLLPGLLRSAAYNIERREDAVRLFEIGRIFPYPDTDRVNKALARSIAQVLDEREMCGVLFAWPEDGVREALQLLSEISDTFGLQRFDIFQQGYADGLPIHEEGPSEVYSLAGLNPSRSGLVVASSEMPVQSDAVGECSPTSLDRAGALQPGTAIGVVGEVDPDVVAHFHAGGISAIHPDGRRIGWLQLDLGLLLDAAPAKGEPAKPISRYPSTDIDLCFTVPREIAAAKISRLLRTAAGDILEYVKLIDVYQFGDGRDRSLTFRIRLSSLDHTLTDTEIAEVRSRCLDILERESGVTLRG
ncbi:MAG: phenylalanine--tRNA ligase subunit beta [Actinobacteria bacterium]|nr:phenylalanine--tRNA ligase subunit beta [Actinomycetota bacterium]MCL5446148.1 phenylalanine--tRNA ligase subunit beta [Actinomycetota bacterium]